MIRIAVILVLAASCSKSEPPEGSASATRTAAATAAAATTSRAKKDPATAKSWIGQGAVVIDVRTPGEFAEGHLPNATNIPVDQVAARLAEVERLVGGDKARSIVTYCASGNRSEAATRTLEGAGYTRVVNGGGLDDLQ